MAEMQQGNFYKIKNARSGYEIGRYAGKVGNVEMFVFNDNEILMLATSEIDRSATAEEIKEEELAAGIRDMFKLVEQTDEIIQKAAGIFGIK